MHWLPVQKLRPLATLMPKDKQDVDKLHLLRAWRMKWHSFKKAPHSKITKQNCKSYLKNLTWTMMIKLMLKKLLSIFMTTTSMKLIKNSLRVSAKLRITSPRMNSFNGLLHKSIKNQMLKIDHHNIYFSLILFNIKLN